MTKQVAKGLILVVLSTLSYYVPLFFSGSPVPDLSKVPSDFYQYYCWMLSGSFALVSIYSVYLFFEIDPKYLAFKIIVACLVIEETFTFVNFVITRFYHLETFNPLRTAAILLGFTFCLGFFLYRSIIRQKSDKFDPRRSYIVKFFPKDFPGFVNYILKRTGHTAIYQDGRIYRFKKRTGKVIERSFTTDLIKEHDVIFKEIPRVKNVTRLIGKKYNLFTYNCNHMVRDARS